MKHKRQTLSKTDEEDNKDSLKGDDDSQPCSKFDISHMLKTLNLHSKSKGQRQSLAIKNAQFPNKMVSILWWNCAFLLVDLGCGTFAYGYRNELRCYY